MYFFWISFIRWNRKIFRFFLKEIFNFHGKRNRLKMVWVKLCVESGLFERGYVCGILKRDRIILVRPMRFLRFVEPMRCPKSSVQHLRDLTRLGTVALPHHTALNPSLSAPMRQILNHIQYYHTIITPPTALSYQIIYKSLTKIILSGSSRFLTKNKK